MNTRRPSSRGPSSRRPAGGRGRGSLGGDPAEPVEQVAPKPVPVSARASAWRRRPRFTGRAGVLALVVAVLVISYASSAKAYLTQRHNTDQLEQQIAQRQSSIDTLQKQVDRWQDPAYIAIQARQQFGYVLPGETPYVALDAEGKKIQPAAQLGAPPGSTQPAKAWWDTVWGSVKLAGK